MKTVADPQVVRSLRARLESEAPDTRRHALEPLHGTFGTMSLADWQRWAYRHTHHHLRQFGL